MRRITPILIVLAALSGLPATAQQDTRAARIASAQTYIAQTMADVDLTAIVRSMYRPVLDQVAANGVTVTQDQIDAIDTLYQTTMQAPLRQILQAQDQVMADLLTLEEIDALSAFYASPIGHAVMTKLPQILERQQPQILAMVQGLMPQIIPEVQRILRR